MNPSPEPSVATPLAPCNLVMKGAIASGVIYPPVINVLKTRYRFQHIGGTSAGAIAAGAAAAAEYRRQKGDGDAGFAQLDALSHKLAEPGVLRGLFQASEKTKPLLDVLPPLLRLVQPESKTAVPEQPPLLDVLQVLRRIWPIPDRLVQFVNTVLSQWIEDYPAFLEGKRLGTVWGSVLGIILGLLIALAFGGLVSIFVPNRPVIVVLFLLCFLLFGPGLGWVGNWLGQWFGAVMMALFKAYDLLSREVVNNFFGMCIGHNDDPDKGDLTDWLYRVFNQMAGLPENTPLTFQHLQETGNGIDLRMVTSNLSHARPYILPDDLHNFVWKETEFRRLFPETIIAHMKEHQDRDGMSDVTLPTGYFFFPEAKQLPVIVAVRLSISFPLLISAIPLYTIDSKAFSQDGTPVVLQENHLQKNWFSDGGICSNFPIQFFDEWLPTYPTFGINLTSLRPVAPDQLSILPGGLFTQSSAQQQQSAPQMRLLQQQMNQQRSPLQVQQQRIMAPSDPQVYLPRADDPYTPEWVGQADLLAFLQAILGTGLYHREISQAGLPSYRERIVQIRMTPEQDGLHLDMTAATILQMMKKGQDAGTLLTAQPPDGFSLEQYQWVRLQVLMALIEENLAKLAASVQEIQGYQHLLETEPGRQHEFPFPHDEEWCKNVRQHLQDLLELSERWQPRAGNMNVLSPDPRSITQHAPVLQVVPEF